ncbi:MULTISPECIES: hypothetical protein [Actinoalloteichus]|uniref:Uncharacterized protein n=1 Tax=Actinoalloteichus fjordicus TaxID=1612552 RepID=A0AAC9LH24_9PSEU|nr:MULTISPECIES: hypothetical protein [Actinoalloteichus]APU16184.1 hypothetical protein UA74_20795 [Actinoalloteichus fjordicus]APU22246.1 hypothetical protein UA75_21285 [Actinoalloteichus sp. GBA129-24]
MVIVGRGPGRGGRGLRRLPFGRSATRAGVAGDRQNIDAARSFAGPRDDAAAPGLGEGFLIISTKMADEVTFDFFPYHAAAVVGVDGNDRVTLEEWAATGLHGRQQHGVLPRHLGRSGRRAQRRTAAHHSCSQAGRKTSS